MPKLCTQLSLIKVMKVWGVVRHFEHENILGIDEKLGRCTFSRNLSNTLKLIMYKEGFVGELLKVRTLQVRNPSLRFFPFFSYYLPTKPSLAP